MVELTAELVNPGAEGMGYIVSLAKLNGGDSHANLEGMLTASGMAHRLVAAVQRGVVLADGRTVRHVPLECHDMMAWLAVWPSGASVSGNQRDFLNLDVDEAWVKNLIVETPTLPGETLAQFAERTQHGVPFIVYLNRDRLPAGAGAGGDHIDCPALKHINLARVSLNPDGKLTIWIPADLRHIAFCTRHAVIRLVSKIVQELYDLAGVRDSAAGAVRQGRSNRLFSVLRNGYGGRPGISISLGCSPGQGRNEALDYNTHDGQTAEAILQLAAGIAGAFAGDDDAAQISSLLQAAQRTCELMLLPYPDQRQVAALGPAAHDLLGYVRLVLGADAVTPYMLVVGLHAGELQRAGLAPLGRLRNERMERLHRLQKDVATACGGGRTQWKNAAGSVDKLGMMLQFRAQFVRQVIASALQPAAKRVNDPGLKDKVERYFIENGFSTKNTLKMADRVRQLMAICVPPTHNTTSLERVRRFFCNWAYRQARVQKRDRYVPEQWTPAQPPLAEGVIVLAPPPEQIGLQAELADGQPARKKLKLDASDPFSWMLKLKADQLKARLTAEGVMVKASPKVETLRARLKDVLESQAARQQAARAGDPFLQQQQEAAAVLQSQQTSCAVYDIPATAPSSHRGRRGRRSP